MRRVALALLCTMFAAGHALGWGATGHELVSGVAAAALPDELPAFLRSPQAVADIAVFGREPDRAKGIGDPHDHERSQAHFLALDDAGTVRGLLLTELPPTREAYDTELRKRGTTQYRQGYLPYAIVDGWQQLVIDFALWRALSVGVTNSDPAERA